jgi:hypothetical protein
MPLGDMIGAFERVNCALAIIFNAIGRWGNLQEPLPALVIFVAINSSDCASFAYGLKIMTLVWPSPAPFKGYIGRPTQGATP